VSVSEQLDEKKFSQVVRWRSVFCVDLTLKLESIAIALSFAWSFVLSLRLHQLLAVVLKESILLLSAWESFVLF